MCQAVSLELQYFNNSTSQGLFLNISQIEAQIAYAQGHTSGDLVVLARQPVPEEMFFTTLHHNCF